MYALRIWRMLLAIVGGVALVIVVLGALTVSPALAQEPELEITAPVAQPPPPNDDDLQFIAFFTEELTIEITDLSGNVVGDGMHGGKVKCNRNKCSQQTHLTFGIPLTDPTVSEYKFTTRQALDPEARRAVVTGEGALSANGRIEVFSFTATFQDNGDGTVSVRYEASRPDASFRIPNAPGRLEFSSR